MDFGLIIIGDEILSGKRQDKHLAKAIELLGERGLQLDWARYVGDDRSLITAELRAAFASGAAVFSCGGIGATPDDHTRQCAAAALDVPLVLHDEARELILQRMRDVATEQGIAFDPDRDDNRHRLNMGVFPVGARIIPNPYNKIPGFSCTGLAGGAVHFMPGFPVMAWPMMAWVLDGQYAALQGQQRHSERSVIVYGAMEAALTQLMEDIEARFIGVRVFSLPSVDHPVHGRHIELGVKGEPVAVEAAYADLRLGLNAVPARLGPELVRTTKS
ncbi:molybdopterin-binding protein [Methylibium sp.]|uniref:competence/damage-inducible protein A n=1 Tax=Methylibium sp. TaxID=2067992 RepID=UPI001857D666|nr:molybdopterin-binding protein [Methylibium sp.]MBA3592154.1 competence/damage-inducible protein A [Methylibium sp.]